MPVAINIFSSRTLLLLSLNIFICYDINIFPMASHKQCLWAFIHTQEIDEEEANVQIHFLQQNPYHRNSN